MANLTEFFKTAEEAEQDTDKLVDLFRNRSELKKEFAALRNEKYRLEDRIKEHRGAIDRRSEFFLCPGFGNPRGLYPQSVLHRPVLLPESPDESLLLDPEWVHNVATFYQLRRLAAHCETRLQRFAEELKQQREKRIRDKSLAAWKSAVEQERERARERLGEQRVRLQALEDQLRAERHDLETRGGLSKLVRRKPQIARMESLESTIAGSRAREAQLLQQLQRIEAREPPPHDGLDIGAKRSINFMILSFLQQLYLDYCDDNLAAMAKEASDKSVGAVNYGSKLECDEILERLAVSREAAEQREPDTEILQARAKQIARHAVFRSDDEAVPTSASVATVFDIMANGVISRLDVNLLGENYFKVSGVVSR